MFDNEDYDDRDEMTPEEESFPVDQEETSENKPSPLSELRQKSGNGSKQDGENLKNTIAGNKAKNASGNIARNANNSGNKPSNDEDEQDNEQDDSKKSKADNLAKDTANEAAKMAATTAMQTAGVPKPVADKVSEKIVDSEQGQKIIDETIKQFKNKKRAMILQFIIPILPYIINIFFVTLVIFSMMSEIMVIVEKVEGAFVSVSTGIEKFLNYTSGEGWYTEDEKFFVNLQEEYKKSLQYSDVEIDIPLLASTIHYNRLMDSSVYEKDKGNTDTSIPENSDSEQLFGNFLEAEDLKNFYYVANDKLGSLTNFFPGERRLIGHMVDISVTMEKYDAHTARMKWETFISFLFSTANDTVNKPILSSLWPPTIIKSIKEKIAYLDLNTNADNYYEYYARNLVYEAKEFNEFLDTTFGEDGKKMDMGETTEEDVLSNKEGILIPAPNIKIVYNEDKYYDYLVNVYIPGTYFSDGIYNDSEVQRIAREIFEQRESYYYLVGDEKKDKPTGNCRYTYGSSTSGSATLSNQAVDSNFVDNLMVELLPASCGGKVSNCTDSDITDVLTLKDYVIGVAYSEIGASLGDNEEWIKANMVAIKSYTLNKNKSTLREENGKYYIKMINNTYQQTYCSVQTGCMERTSNRKGPLTDEAKTFLYDLYDEVKPMFLYSSTGGFVGSYRSDYSMCVSSGLSGLCMGQNDSEDDANNGLSYQNILGKYYTQDVGLFNISSNELFSSVYQCYSPGLVAGQHGNMMIRTSKPTPNDIYYNEPYVSNSNRGQCVWYVKGRASEIIATTVTDSAIRDTLLGVLRNAKGNGNQWYNEQLQSVFGSSSDYTKPKAGSIGVYDWTDSKCRSYHNGSCTIKYGHVIMIESVDEINQTVTYTDGYAYGGSSCSSNWDCVRFNGPKPIPISKLSDLGGEYIFIGYIYLLD